MNALAGMRAGMLQLNLTDEAHLLASYMPWVTNGGIFVPSNRPYKLGDEIFVVLTLPSSSDRFPVAGHVAWITPQGSRAAGVGVQFPATPDGAALKAKIESMLAGRLESETPTYTM